MSETLRALLDPRARPSGTMRLPARVARTWRLTLDRLLPLGGSSEGNQVTFFFDGDDSYEAMLAAIHSATRRVWIETYIFEPDRVGRAFLDALLAARRRGVDVVLLFDVIGSSGLKTEDLLPLRESGARVVPFNPPRLFFARLPMFLRDHRKILIIDDVGFCGGMNVSEDYAGTRLGNGRFRDTHACIEGPGVRDLAAIFISSYLTATGKKLQPAAPLMPLADGVFAQILGSDVRRRKRHIQRALYYTVGRSVRTCLLTTPYFVPPPRLLRALVRAARRGVDVRVLTAGLSDVPIAAVAARHLYGSLLRGGVRIFEMMGRTLHAKTASIDGIYASVGSFNLDRWSFTRNLEVSLTVVDPGLADLLASQFETDATLCREVRQEDYDARSLIDRALGWFAFQLMRL